MKRYQVQKMTRFILSFHRDTILFRYMIDCLSSQFDPYYCVFAAHSGSCVAGKHGIKQTNHIVPHHLSDEATRAARPACMARMLAGRAQHSLALTRLVGHEQRVCVAVWHTEYSSVNDVHGWANSPPNDLVVLHPRVCRLNTPACAHLKVLNWPRDLRGKSLATRVKCLGDWVFFVQSGSRFGSNP